MIAFCLNSGVRTVARFPGEEYLLDLLVVFAVDLPAMSTQNVCSYSKTASLVDRTSRMVRNRISGSVDVDDEGGCFDASRKSNGNATTLALTTVLLIILY